MIDPPPPPLSVRVSAPFARALEAELVPGLHAGVQRVASSLGLAIAPAISLDGDGTGPEPGIWIEGQRLRYSREAVLRARMSALRRLLTEEEAAAGAAGIADEATEPASRASWIARIVELALIRRPELLASTGVVAALAPAIEVSAEELAALLRGVLACGVSIGSITALRDAIHALPAGTPAQRGEHLLSRFHPREVSLELAPATLVELLLCDPHRDRAPFATVHERAHAELGIVLPRIRLVLHTDLPPRCYRVRVNHLAELPLPLLPVDRALTDRVHEGSDVHVLSWHGASGVHRIEPDAKEDELTALDYLADELHATLMARAPRLVEEVELRRSCGLLGKPSLVALAVASPHYTELPRILRALLAEGVPIGDLGRILEQLIDFQEVQTPPPRSHIVLTHGFPVSDGLPAPPDRLVEAMRLVLGGATRARVGRGTEVSALLLAPAVERALAGEPSADWCDALVEKIAGLAGATVDALLTSLEIRPRLRALCADVLPDLPVLSFQELPSDTNVTPAGTVDVPSPSSLARPARSAASAAPPEEGFALWLADAALRAPALDRLIDDKDAPPQPKETLRRARAFAADHGLAPDSLADQGWGVVVPVGPRGDELAAAIKPLIEYRVNEQRALHRLYRVPPQLDASASGEWVRNVFEAEPEHRRPRYLLILGDISEVSLDLQLGLAPVAGVGRLAFDELADYTRYATKAVAADRRRRDRLQASVFLCDDGSRANAIARTQLVEPCLSNLAELGHDRRYRLASAPIAGGGKAGILAQAREADLLFTVCHGAGSKMSYAERRKLQGALLTATGELMTGDDVKDGPFLRDGVWLMFACYGLGTPARSSYSGWIDDLYRLQRLRDRDHEVIAEGQLADGELPFIADLPRRALANPEGPLAVIGHVDLAWSYGFTHEGQSRFDRLFTTLRVLLQEQLAGFALEQIVRNCVIASDQLAQLYLQRRENERGVAPPVEPRLLARTWMLRQDLRGFILLGDPAARLRLSGTGSPP